MNLYYNFSTYLQTDSFTNLPHMWILQRSFRVYAVYNRAELEKLGDDIETWCF